MPFDFKGLFHKDPEKEPDTKDPGPREDLPEEPSHPAARIRDRERGRRIGDVVEEKEGKTK